MNYMWINVVKFTIQIEPMIILLRKCKLSSFYVFCINNYETYLKRSITQHKHLQVKRMILIQDILIFHKNYLWYRNPNNPNMFLILVIPMPRQEKE